MTLEWTEYDDGSRHARMLVCPICGDWTRETAVLSFPDHLFAVHGPEDVGLDPVEDVGAEFPSPEVRAADD